VNVVRLIIFSGSNHIAADLVTGATMAHRVGQVHAAPADIAEVVAEAESCLREKVRGQVLEKGVREFEEDVGPPSTGAPEPEEVWAGVAATMAPRTDIGCTASRVTC
jgi:hypothetical protein